MFPRSWEKLFMLVKRGKTISKSWNKDIDYPPQECGPTNITGQPSSHNSTRISELSQRRRLVRSHRSYRSIANSGTPKNRSLTSLARKPWYVSCSVKAKWTKESTDTEFPFFAHISDFQFQSDQALIGSVTDLCWSDLSLSGHAALHPTRCQRSQTSSTRWLSLTQQVNGWKFWTLFRPSKTRRFIS